VSILKTLAELAIAAAKLSEAAPVANITPSVSARNLPANVPQPAMTPTAAEARARLERRLAAPSTLPAKPGASSQASGGGSGVLPFVCAPTRKPFAFKLRQNRYSGRWFFQETIKELASGNGAAADLQSFRLDDIEWNAAQCPHCAASFFALGPLRCGACERYACRGGMNESTGFFSCACGHSGQVMAGLDSIEGAKSPALPPHTTTPLLAAGKAVPQLRAPPPPNLLKG
jgi:hypothetical protein